MTPTILPNLPETMRVADASKILRCSDMHVYQLIRDGALKAVSVGSSKSTAGRGRYLVLADDLREFIHRRRSA